MIDDENASTIPDRSGPTHANAPPIPRSPDARYAMRTLLGKGGMGEVWLARDLRVDRDIAIKLMLGDSSEDRAAVMRFLREARVQGRLEHPSVVPVHDLGGEQSSPFFTMKKLAGRTLADVIGANDHAKWPRRALLTRFVDICLAIEFAHQRGVIHRDLKPANIMLGDFGETYVLDWGLARLVDGVHPDPIRNRDDSGGDGDVHTEAGQMLGTPGYMAPEQMRGEVVDQRTDIYALGCILFEILTTKPAIAREHVFDVTLTAACHRPAQRYPEADVPPELDDACARATAADPGVRMTSARALADEVQRFLDGDRDLDRRRELATGHGLRARELLAINSIESRAEAMREAGSAIALDPSNRDAKGVLARLLLEPPREIPPAARERIDDERQRAMAAVLRGGLLVYLLSLFGLPIGSYLGVDTNIPVIILAIELALLASIFGLALWRRWVIGRALVLIVAMLHVSLLATVGVVLGPLIVLPMLVFGSLQIMLMMPALRFPKTVFALHALALLLPFSLELLHLVPSTFSFADGRLVIEPWAMTLSREAFVFAVFALIAVQLVGNTIILDGQRRAQDRAQELVHVQAWQLAQLVPDTANRPQ